MAYNIAEWNIIISPSVNDWHGDFFYCESFIFTPSIKRISAGYTVTCLFRSRNRHSFTSEHQNYWRHQSLVYPLHVLEHTRGQFASILRFHVARTLVMKNLWPCLLSIDVDLHSNSSTPGSLGSFLINMGVRNTNRIKEWWFQKLTYPKFQ